MQNLNNQNINSGLSQKLFSNYISSDRCFCEAFESSGQCRAYWMKFIEGMDKMGWAEFQKRIGQADRMLQEHGATYNLFDDPEDTNRPWELDLIPFLISPQDWLLLESGLIQRTRLLNAILQDIYTEQKLLKHGQLPPELVFANPNFLRSCSGIELPGKGYLVLSAVDIGRAIDGTWRIINTKTQVPKGAGFSLENRIIISQVMSRMFHQTRVQRLAPFFIDLNQYLKENSFYNRDDPTIVLYSPGPTSETYFEHSFLSRYMGYPMVESGDLTVRDNKVYMKTLGGLELVDVIFRWIGDSSCDPLALKGDPNFGVSGLIQATRCQNVMVANAIGSGIIESPAFSSFLPSLCAHILGEDLILNELTSLWCGNPDNLNLILSQLDQYIIRPSFNARGSVAIDSERLSSNDRELLIQKIKNTPYQYVAQEKMTLSTIPTLFHNDLQPGNAILRFYISATQDDFQVMPGGLARIAEESSSLMTSGGEYGLSKDIWIISEKPVLKVSLMDRLEKAMEIKRTGSLSSRVADNMLWLGRYLERVENQIRLYRSIFKRLSGELSFLEIPELPMLFKMADDRGLISLSQMKKDENFDLFEMQNELLDAVYDRNRITSLAATLNQIHRAATNVRDRLSLDSWRVLTRIDNAVKKTDSEQWIQISDTYDLMNELLMILSAFSGLAMESMTRGMGWCFMDMGRRIERSDFIVNIIRSALTSDVNNTDAMLDTLLEVADSSMTYRSRYRTRIQLSPVMDLLIADEINPKSIAFQLVALSEHVETLPRNGIRKYSTPEERILLSVLTTVRLADIISICKSNQEDRLKDLIQILTTVETSVHDFTNYVSQYYFTRIPATKHLTSLYPEGK